MLEDRFRRRTVELLTSFQHEVEELSRSGPTTADVIARMNGVAKNTIRLLRENKTKSVRTEQAQPGVIDFPSINDEIDDAIQRVFTAKASWRNLQARTATPPPTEQIDLTGELITLAELHQAGVLSDAEFAAAKARLR